MNHWFHPEARTELLESLAYYNLQQAGLGQRFLDSLIEGLNRITAHPELYRVVIGNWRQCRIPRFPYGLIYRVRNRKIEIIAVMHLHRNPGYWKDRTA